MAYADGAPPQESSRPAPPLSACGIARAADLVGDRWSLLIIREALYGVTRFDAMQADLQIPRTVLSGRLKKLRQAGVLTTRPYQAPGQRRRHQYVLTSKGVDLALAMLALMEWGEKQLPDGAPAARLVERRTGAPCRIGLVTEAGRPVAIGETRLRHRSSGIGHRAGPSF